MPEILRLPPWEAAPPRRYVVEGLAIDSPHDHFATWRPYDLDERDGPWDEVAAAWDAGTATEHEIAELVCWGPAELIESQLDRWVPGDGGRWAVKQAAARFHEPVFPWVLAAARENPGSFLDYGFMYPHPELAFVAAHVLRTDLKKRETAVLWLGSFTACAAYGLIPEAVGPEPPDGFVMALREVAKVDRRWIDIAARHYGAVQAVDELLLVPAEESLPAVVPMPPDFVEPSTLPPLALRGGECVLSEDDVVTLLRISMLGRPTAPHPALAVALDAFDWDSRAAWAWEVFDRWMRARGANAHRWILTLLARCADDTTVVQVLPLIHKLSSQSGAWRSIQLLEVLVQVGSDLCISELVGLRQRARKVQLRDAADAALDEIAASRGEDRDDIEDRGVPDCGLGADGSLELDYGSRRFTVGFDEELLPFVCDESGARRASLPKAAKADDPELADAARAQFSQMKKQVRSLALTQIERLERTMVVQRRWTHEHFRRWLVEHPLMRHLISRLVLGVYSEEGLEVAFRVAEDGSYADVDDQVIELPATASIGVVHRLDLDDESAAAWAQILDDYDLRQPFDQIERSIHVLTDDERSGTSLDQFAGTVGDFGRFLALERRGWRLGERGSHGVTQAFSRSLDPERRIFLRFSPGIFVHGRVQSGRQTIDFVHLLVTRDGRSTAEPFNLLSPIEASELLRDLTSLTAGD